MDPDRLRAVARNLFESSKAGDDRTLGEKAIGLLAFQQLGGCCEIVSRAERQRRDVDVATPPRRRRLPSWSARSVGRVRRAGHDGVHLRARHRSRTSAHPTQGRRVHAPPSRGGDRRRRLRDRGRRGPHRRARHARRTGRAADPARRARHAVGQARVRPLRRRRHRRRASRRRRWARRHHDHRRPRRPRGVRPRAVDQRSPLGPGVVRAVAPVGGPSGDPARRRDLSGVPGCRALRRARPHAGHRAGPPRPRRRHRRAPR